MNPAYSTFSLLFLIAFTSACIGGCSLRPGHQDGLIDPAPPASESAAESSSQPTASHGFPGSQSARQSEGESQMEPSEAARPWPPNRTNRPESPALRSNVMARNGMVAAAHPLASQAGLDMLKAGGNAIDAAIAANAVMTLADPGNNGIGGDLFALVWIEEQGRLYGLNASGRSPMGLPADTVRARSGRQLPLTGQLTVSVPGCVDGWFKLHERFGALGMDRLLEPTISYAREGIPLTEWIAHYWNAPGAARNDPWFMETFMPWGRSPRAGELFTNPRLAQTYERLAAGGRDVFYRGEIAREIDGWMRENGGWLRYEDMAAHRSEWVDPIPVRYRDVELWQLPPNTQGLAALQMLAILEHFPVGEWEFGSAEHIHHIIEAKKLAFEDMARYYADPDFHTVPAEELLRPEYIRKRAALVDSQKASVHVPAGSPFPSNTIYVTAADRHGNMVSLIQSNAAFMGSGIVPGSLGFVLQNRGAWFTLEEGHPNEYEPGKRPFHTIMPGFVTKNGRPWLSYGVIGGLMQPQAQVQILMNMVDFGMNPQEAGDAPRVEHQGSSSPRGDTLSEGGRVLLQSGISDATAQALRAIGHQVGRHGPGFYGGFQAIFRDPHTGVYWGASESVQDGQAVGY